MTYNSPLKSVCGFGVAEFVRKAVEGGWRSDEYSDEDMTWYEIRHGHLAGENGLAHMLINPAAWRAVGKVEGWRTGMTFADTFNGRKLSGYEYHMHRFLDALQAQEAPVDN